MSYQATLEVLAEPTRQALIERLREGPLPVVELAAGLSVSRPAVSKHLKVMKQAGVVSMTQNGNRNVYELNLEALEELKEYLDSFWDTSLARFKRSAENTYQPGAADDE